MGRKMQKGVPAAQEIAAKSPPIPILDLWQILRPALRAPPFAIVSTRQEGHGRGHERKGGMTPFSAGFEWSERRRRNVQPRMMTIMQKTESEVRAGMVIDADASKKVRFADLKPYAFPASLQELHGPEAGEIELPLHILWSPGSKIESLDTTTGRSRAYQAVLSEGSAEDICRFVNSDALIGIWPDLDLPIQVAKGWEARFPELHGNMRASW